jgi:hypothetical protein
LREGGAGIGLKNREHGSPRKMRMGTDKNEFKYLNQCIFLTIKKMTGSRSW